MIKNIRNLALLLALTLLIGHVVAVPAYALETDEKIISEIDDSEISEADSSVIVEDQTESDEIEGAQTELEETGIESEPKTKKVKKVENSWRYEDGVWLGGTETYSSLAYENAWGYENGHFVNSLGEPIPGAVLKGIDVSSHNGEINWEQVVAESDIDYAIIRCGYGDDLLDQDDPYWERNASECTRLGIPFGVYIYSYAESVEEARSEAEHVLRCIEGYDLSYPVYYDLEDDWVAALSNEEIGDIAETFCGIIQNSGYDVGVYANLWWFNNRLTELCFDKWDKWVAHYNDYCGYTDDYQMWQCTNTGSVPGIRGNVDLNFVMGSQKQETDEDGFVTIDGDTYYYKNGERLLGKHKIEDKWYLFDSRTGIMYKGEIIEDGHWVYYSEEDGAKSYGWSTHHGKTCYYDENGWMVYGEQEIDGKKYYLHTGTGALYKGERFEDGHWTYYSEEDGAKAHGWSAHHGKTCYYDENGWMVYGEQEIDGKKYYFHPGTGALTEGWFNHYGNTYYYDKEKGLLYGDQEIDGKIYGFHPKTGVQYTGEINQDGHWTYYSEETGIKAYGWTEHHGKTCYYDENGWMVYGEQEIDGEKYYFHPGTGALTNGWFVYKWQTYYYDKEQGLLYGDHEIEGKEYKFDPITGVLYKGELYENGHWMYFSEEDGAKAYGWTEHHGKTCYYNENGWMVYGNQEIDGKTYYFHPGTGALTTGWFTYKGATYYYHNDKGLLYGHQTIDGKEYYFDSKTGILYKGELKENGHWMYFSEEDGAKAYGWAIHHGNTYYYDENGWMVYGEQVIDGKKFRFHSTRGTMYKGELYEDGHWLYYSETDGAQVFGWVTYGGNSYYYDENGWKVYGRHTIDGKVYKFDGITGAYLAKYNNQMIPHRISDFPLIYQNPELPTGCEVVALTMALRYEGYSVSKTTMASVYLPTAPFEFTVGSDGRTYGPDLDYYFVGDPYGKGSICGTPAIVTAANLYLQHRESNLRAKDITGCSFEELYTRVSQDQPVIVWSTIGMENRWPTYKGWYTSAGKYVHYSRNDHGSVLIGWDEKSVRIACPIYGIKTYSRSQFEKVFASRGYKAVVLE